YISANPRLLIFPLSLTGMDETTQTSRGVCHGGRTLLQWRRSAAGSTASPATQATGSSPRTDEGTPKTTADSTPGNSQTRRSTSLGFSLPAATLLKSLARPTRTKPLL